MELVGATVNSREAKEVAELVVAEMAWRRVVVSLIMSRKIISELMIYFGLSLYRVAERLSAQTKTTMLCNTQ